MINTVLFGAGQVGAMVARLLGVAHRAVCFADNSEAKWGGSLAGLPIVSPRESLALGPDCVCLCVLDAERDFYQRMNANPLRGLYSLSVEATDAIAKVRQQIADLIGASQANEIVFTRNTSESLNLVAKSFAPTVLEPGDEVVITIMEHHSNLIPWQQVCRETGAMLVYLYPTKTGQLTTEEVLAKVGPKTKILAVGQVSNVLGVENPVKNLGKLVHKYGGYLVVDGAQSLPHMPVDVADLGADFFAFSAHKAMGPMGIGGLYGTTSVAESVSGYDASRLLSVAVYLIPTVFLLRKKKLPEVQLYWGGIVKN